MTTDQITSELLKDDLDYITELQRAWYMFDLPGTLSATQAHVWINLHGDPYRLLFGISKTSQRADELTDAGTPMTTDHAIRHMSRILNRLKDEQEKETTNEKQ
jgi:hypothetical protein